MAGTVNVNVERKTLNENIRDTNKIVQRSAPKDSPFSEPKRLEIRK